MSIAIAAQHLQHHGRNGDTMLVHMSPKEVKSLNDLAMAHGGHLTTNPHTGLPEAGFLSSLLPMIAGAALTATGVGAPMAAMLVGGGSYLMNPEKGLMGGLMAGLGAYGGANLGASLAAQGMTSAAPAAQVLPEATQPFTADPSAYTPFNATSGNFGAFGETPGTAMAQAPTGPQVVAQNAVNSPPPGVAYPDYQAGLANSSSAPPAQVASTSSGPEAFKQGTITQPITSGMTAADAKEAFANASPTERLSAMQRGFTGENLMNYAKENPMQTAGMLAGPISELNKKKEDLPVTDKDMGQRFTYSSNRQQPTGATGEQQYFAPSYTKVSNEEAKRIYGFADGGEASAPAASSGSISSADTSADMSPDLANFLGLQAARTSMPAAPSHNVAQEFADYKKQYSPVGMRTPTVGIGTPNPIDSGGEGTYTYDPVTKQFTKAAAAPSVANTNYAPDPGPGYDPGGYPGGGMAAGGLSHLGDYSDGGRLLKGPGDGISDSIPAVIGQKQPARLADGEFVIPARIVSELGNGSTEAGARRLYAMMDRVQKARGKTVGKGKVAKNSRADKYLPA